MESNQHIGHNVDVENIEKFFEVLGKFYVCFEGNKVIDNEGSFADVVLPSEFFKSVVQKLKDYYSKNVNKINDFKKIVINEQIYGKSVDLEFVVISRKNKVFFILVNDNYVRYEFFRTSILNTLSHELKTPLTIIKGYIQYVMKSFSNESNLSNIMATMLSETYRLEEIISELIEVSKFYSDNVIIRKDVFSVKNLISMVVNKFEPKIKSRDIKLEIEIVSNDFEVIADFEKIRYVISELIENSIKYGKNRILIRTFEDFDGFYFEVIDNGRGMPKEIQKNIFNLFVRTDNELNRKIYGLGVGLFLVKKIVEAHKGEVIIKSKVNKGTKVTIFIPRNFSPSHSLFAGR